MWDQTAVTAERTLVVSLVVGQRTHEQTAALVHDTKRRLRAGPLPVLFTDAYEGDVSAIFAAFGRRYPAPSPGPRGPSRRSRVRWPQGWAEGQVKKPETSRGSARGEVRLLSGKARVKHVRAWLGSTQGNTRVVARQNGTRRVRNPRKVRKTLAFSKVPRSPRWMRWLAVGLYNVCRAHRS